MLVPIIRRHMPAFSPICCKADVLLFSSHLTRGFSPTKRATLVRSLSIVLEDRPKIYGQMHLRQAVRLRLDNVAQGYGNFSSLLMRAPLQHFLCDDPTNAACSPTVLSSITWTRNKIILLTYFHLKVRIFTLFFPFARGQIVSSQHGHLQT